MRNIALKLMYNGTAYHGWQVQKNAVTVCETLQNALAKITGAPVHLTGCGRTDAGVHAERYVANFHTESRIPLDLEAGLELRQLDDTVLLRLDSMVSLLPLQLSDGGASWHYSSQAEMFYQCDWYASFQDPSGEEAKAINGAFHVYRNGKRVFTGQETEEWYVLEADGERVDAMRFDCAPGDHMRLTYTCEDAFGLHYEFPIREQVALAWDDMRDCPLSHTPTVTWPK